MEDNRGDAKQLSMLQEMLRRYCREHGQTVHESSCKLTWLQDDGTRLVIYKRPKVLLYGGIYLYGVIDYSDGRPFRYLGEEAARHLHRILVDRLKE